MNLFIRCPHCYKEINLGENAMKIYNSPSAFILDEKCPYCENCFDHNDTTEGDYRIG